MKVDAVDAIAEGRVWSGTEAKKIGLVDEIGGLDAAIALAAKKASVGEEFAVLEYPERKTFLENLTEQLTRKREDSAKDGAAMATVDAALQSSGPLGAFVKDGLQGLRAVAQYNDPHGLYARLPFDAALR